MKIQISQGKAECIAQEDVKIVRLPFCTIAYFEKVPLKIITIPLITRAMILILY